MNNKFVEPPDAAMQNKIYDAAPAARRIAPVGEMRREEEKDGGDKEITEAMPEPGQKLRRRGREV